MVPPGVLVSAHPGDALASGVETLLREGGTRVRSVPLGALGSVGLTIEGDHLLIDEMPVACALVRPGLFGCFSDEYRPEDRSFCDAEVRAVWLAAMHLGSLLAVNRYDPGAWLQRTSWPRIRSDLRSAGVPVAPLAFGGAELDSEPAWLPYHSDRPRRLPGKATRRAMGCALAMTDVAEVQLAVFGNLIADGSDTSRQAADHLNRQGLLVAEIALDAEGRVLAVNPEPVFDDPGTALLVAQTIVDQFDDHLSRR